MRCECWSPAKSILDYWHSALYLSDPVLVAIVTASAICQSVQENMGNKPAKQEKEEVLLKIVPPLDHTYVRWLARDLERIHGYIPKNPCAVKPPDHYIEYMRMNGWLDLNLDDPDLIHLFK